MDLQLPTWRGISVSLPGLAIAHHLRLPPYDEGALVDAVELIKVAVLFCAWLMHINRINITLWRSIRTRWTTFTRIPNQTLALGSA